MTTLLVLRPQPGGDATAGRIRALGLTACTAPLFELVPVAWSPPPVADVACLLVTSAAVFRLGGAGVERYRALPVVAVGEATAAAARAAGFNDVGFAGGGNAQAAAAMLSERGARRVLHLGGEDRVAVNVPGATVTRVTVYAAAAIEPPASFFEALRARAVALVHSPRAGERLAALVTNRAGVAVAAISAAALAAAGTGWRRTAIAARPTDAALIEAAATLVRAE